MRAMIDHLAMFLFSLILTVLVALSEFLALPGHAAPIPEIEDRSRVGVTEPDSVEATAGIVYLGGHRLTPPFTLRYREGSISINDLWIDHPDQVHQAPPSRRSQHLLLEKLRELALSLRADDLPDSLVLDSLRAYCATDRLVRRTAKLGVTGLAIEFTDGFVVNDLLPSGGRTSSRLTRRQREMKDLLEAKRLLDEGGLIVIAEEGVRLTVPGSRITEVEAVIARLKAGLSLSPAEQEYLSEDLRALLVHPVALRGAH